MKKSLLLILVLIITLSSIAQTLYKGIVIDSASFEELPNVLISVKHSDRRTISSFDGRYSIQAHTADTLVFIMFGYKPIELPLYFEEDVSLIRMCEFVKILDEVVIRATRLYPNEIVSRTKVTPKKMSAIEGVFSPFDYFWKLEREKRKLTRIVNENNKAQTYVQVINDPVVKEIMMKAYNLTELIYYERLAVFNQQRAPISYSTDPEEIMESLHEFFKKK